MRGLKVAVSGRRTAYGRTPRGRFAAARRPVNVVVNVRRQTAQEGRQFTAAFNLLLAEWVRQELVRVRKST